MLKKKENLRIKGHKGTWYVIGEKKVGDKDLYLLEHEDFGEEAHSIIIDENLTVIKDHIQNGFDDLD